jgi:putative oxidoreductase
MDFALLILRIVVGLLFIGHGTQKLFGWFNGPGIERFGGVMHQLGYRPGAGYATLGGLAEAGGGSLLLLGLVTPLGSFAIIAMMVNAIAAVHWSKGLWNSEGGFEFPLTLAAVAAALAFAGPGSWSLDAAIGWAPFGNFVGVAATAAGIAFGLAAYASRNSEVRDQEAERRRAA